MWLLALFYHFIGKTSALPGCFYVTPSPPSNHSKNIKQERKSGLSKMADFNETLGAHKGQSTFLFRSTDLYSMFVCLFERPTSVIRTTTIVSPDQWNVMSYRIISWYNFLTWFFYSSRNKVSPKNIPDPNLWMTEVGCIRCTCIRQSSPVLETVPTSLRNVSLQ